MKRALVPLTTRTTYGPLLNTLQNEPRTSVKKDKKLENKKYISSYHGDLFVVIYFVSIQHNTAIC